MLRTTRGQRVSASCFAVAGDPGRGAPSLFEERLLDRLGGGLLHGGAEEGSELLISPEYVMTDPASEGVRRMDPVIRTGAPVMSTATVP